MFCFAFGFVLGVLAALGLAGSMAWRLLRGADGVAAAKLLERLTLAVCSAPEAEENGTPAEAEKPAAVPATGNWLRRTAEKPNNDHYPLSPGDGIEPEKAGDGKTERSGHGR